MNKIPSTHLKNGDVSAYGLACGYVQSASVNTKEVDTQRLHKELYSEHGIYHVRSFRDSERVKWDTYTKVSEARKQYRNTVISAYSFTS